MNLLHTIITVIALIMTPEQIIQNTLKHEGGFSFHKQDKGGATNRGITIKTYQQVKPNATVEDLKNLSEKEAIQIYLDLYFYKPQVDKLPERIQDVMFDSNVHHGPVMATKLLQRALRYLGHTTIQVDGILGSETLKTAFKTDSNRLRTAIIKQRERLFANIINTNPKQAVFYRGWMNRLNSFKEV